MTSPLLYSLAGGALFGLALLAFFLRPEPLRRILSLNVAGTGIFLILVALAARRPGVPDPVPLAMVLTGIVVAVSATALALALATRLGSREAEEYREEGP